MITLSSFETFTFFVLLILPFDIIKLNNLRVTFEVETKFEQRVLSLPKKLENKTSKLIDYTLKLLQYFQ